MKAATNCFLQRRQIGLRVATTGEISDIGGLVIGALMVIGEIGDELGK